MIGYSSKRLYQTKILKHLKIPEKTASNKLTNAYIDGIQTQQFDAKVFRNNIGVLNRTKVDPTTQSIRNKLDKAKFKRDTFQIRSHLFNYQTSADHIDASIYGKAIKNCALLQDYASCTKIMDMLIQQVMENVKPVTNLNVIVFSVYFNAMANADQPLMAYKYFMTMINLKIEPNQICFSTLIKSCRQQAKYKLAERYWKLMENTYNIEPNNFICTEMISVYSKANKPKKGIAVFNKWINTLNEFDKENTRNTTVFGAYLNIFSRIGDLKGMNKAIKLIKKYKYQLNVVMYDDLMRGFIVARSPNKAIKFYKKLIKDELKPSLTTVHLKGVALLHIIRNDETMGFDDKLKIYKKLKSHNKKEYIKYGLQPTPFAASFELTAAIALYHNVRPQKIMAIFEKLMLREDGIGYKIEGRNSSIDFHHFEHLAVQFMLRYVIGYKLDELDFNENNDLAIIVGKGKHSQKGGIEQSYSIKQFVIDELKKFDPPILPRIDHSNKGRIFISRDQLIPYLSTNTNYAVDKLTKPSDDWYLHDPRNSNIE